MAHVSRVLFINLAAHVSLQPNHEDFQICRTGVLKCLKGCDRDLGGCDAKPWLKAKGRRIWQLPEVCDCELEQLESPEPIYAGQVVPMLVDKILGVPQGGYDWMKVRGPEHRG